MNKRVFLLIIGILFINFISADTNISSTFIQTTGNLTLGEKITFAFGEIIDNIVNGWITITGGLRIDGVGNFSSIIYYNNATSIISLNETHLIDWVNASVLISNTSLNQRADSLNLSIGVVNGTLFLANTSTNLRIDSVNSSLLIINSSVTDLNNSLYWNRSGTNVNLRYPGDSVGIGTSSPASELHVVGDVEIVTSTGNLLWMNRSGRENWRMMITGSGDDGLAFYNSDDGEYRLFLDEAGHVGIGTTSPGKKMEIAGDATTGENQLLRLEWKDGAGAGTADIFDLGVDSAGTQYGFGIWDAGGNEILNLANYGSGNAGLSIGSYAGTEAPSNGMILAGKVGIGTTSPTHRLNVIGHTNLSGNLYAGNSSVFVNASSGNVGIGTTGPGSPLHVGARTIPNFAGVGGYNPNSGEFWGSVDFSTGAAPLVVMDSAGTYDTLNIGGGILFGGQYAPDTGGYGEVGAGIKAQRESVVNAADDWGLGFFTRKNDAALDEVVRITKDGNVGIGTTSPTASLDIQNTGVNDTTTMKLGDNSANCTLNPEPSTLLTACSSDIKFKENIKDAPSPRNEFMNIAVKEFTSVGTGKTYIGVVAQELKLTNPNMVLNNSLTSYPYKINITKTKNIQNCSDTPISETCEMVLNITTNLSTEICTPIYETKCTNLTEEYTEEIIDKTKPVVDSYLSVISPNIWKIVKWLQEHETRITKLEQENIDMKKSLCKLGETQWC